MVKSQPIAKQATEIATALQAITFSGLTIFIGANIKKGPQIKLILLIYTNFKYSKSLLNAMPPYLWQVLHLYIRCISIGGTLPTVNATKMLLN